MAAVNPKEDAESGSIRISRIKGGEGKSKGFKQFDVIPTTDANYLDLISDHTFASKNCHESLKLGPGSTAIIMREWKILQEDLPDTIFVRTYEDRIDLLTAVIVGPRGTPYHKGLFFYDIQIPSGYPVLHPKLCRRTRGLNLNPSLNPGQGICFKHIKPESTCILALLLSIQEYLICSEPKHDHDVDQPNYVLPTFWGYWMEKEYLTFREDVFMLNCQTMLTILRKPLKYFEEFVKHHFNDSAESILFFCKLYIDRIPSKVYVDNSKQIVTEGEMERYKKSMKSIYAELIKEFMKNGSKYSLENHIKVANINMEDTMAADAVNIDDIANQNKEIDKKNDEWVFWGLSLPIKAKKLIRIMMYGSK